MTQQERKTHNGAVNKPRDNGAAYASQLQLDAAMMQDDVLGIKQAYQDNADLMSEVVAYRRLAESLRGES